MGQPLSFAEIYEKIRKVGLFSSIERYPYMPYNMDTALKVVEQIGKNRNQKFRIDDENRFAYSNMIR